MSSDTFIAYFGLRFEISIDEAEAVEDRSDARVVAARKAGLKYYWGNFGGLQERYLLFVGEQIGILGDENAAEVSLPLNDVRLSIDGVKEKLGKAGLFGAPELHLSWQPDI